MFCCLTGNKKDANTKLERKELPRTKKPEDFMRDPIPLALSEKIKFTFDRTLKWNCETGEEGRAQKKDEVGLKEKLETMRDKLRRMRMQDEQLAERVQADKKTDDQLTIQLAKLKAQSQALQWAIANSKLEIRKYKQRV